MSLCDPQIKNNLPRVENDLGQIHEVVAFFEVFFASSIFVFGIFYGQEK